jgi:hypothetical protein
LPFPASGIDVTNEEHQQRPNTSPLAINVRLRDPLHRRLRGGSRPGISRYIDAKVGGATSVIQHLEAITTINADALPANQWDAEAERFYAGDPSVPVPEGWEFLGDYTETADYLDEYVIEPRTQQKIPKKGTGYPPRPPGYDRKIYPRLRWPVNADITFPTPITVTQLNVKAHHPETNELVAGTFEFWPDKGVVLPVGVDHPLRTIFWPTETSKYLAVGGRNKVTVNGYTGGTFTYLTVTYPTTLTLLFEWGPYSWTTTATGAGSPPVWTVQGLPHTFVDLDNGNADGLIVINDLSTGFSPPVAAGTTPSLVWVNSSTLGINLPFRFGDGGIPGGLGDANAGYYEIESPSSFMTLANPLNPAASPIEFLYEVKLRQNSSIVSYPFTVTITGPTV